MVEISRTAGTLAAHAVCMAAGLRDCARAAQFYTRDMSRVDGLALPGRSNPPFLSRLVAKLARLADCFMTWSTNTAINLFLPSWRQLPSPFAPGMINAVSAAIRENSLVHNPLYNAYFFRAAVRLAQRYSTPPYLVLEHRVDASRRLLAENGGDGEFLAQALLALVEAAPVARIGKPLGPLLEDIEPNVAIYAIACVALLFAKEGKPMAIHNEDEFFAMVAALIQPSLKDIADCIRARDVAGLDKILQNLLAMY